MRSAFSRITGFVPDRLGEDVLLARSGSDPGARRRAFADRCHHEHLVRALDAAGIGLVLDVGANHGQFGILLRRLGYRGPIVSFEPSRDAFSVLASATKADPAWQAHQIALGNEDAMARLNVARSDQFSSLLRRNRYSIERFGDSSRQTGIEEVPIRRLESLFPELAIDPARVRVFLKLDTQGFDLEVFRGLGHYRTSLPLLQSEVSFRSIYDGAPRYLDTLREYEESGLHLLSVNPVAYDETGMSLLELDCLLGAPDRW